MVFVPCPSHSFDEVDSVSKLIYQGFCGGPERAREVSRLHLCEVDCGCAAAGSFVCGRLKSSSDWRWSWVQPNGNKTGGRQQWCPCLALTPMLVGVLSEPPLHDGMRCAWQWLARPAQGPASLPPMPRVCACCGGTTHGHEVSPACRDHGIEMWQRTCMQHAEGRTQCHDQSLS